MDDEAKAQALQDLKLFRGVAVVLVIVIVFSSIFYHLVERWSYLDSLYFTFVTIATVGYGDFVPTTPASKIYTILLIMVGISLFGFFAQLLLKRQGERHKSRKNKNL